MTPPKAERPFEQSGLPFDSPLTTPETSHLTYGHLARADLLDPSATLDRLWVAEDQAILDILHTEALSRDKAS